MPRKYKRGKGRRRGRKRSRKSSNSGLKMTKGHIGRFLGLLDHYPSILKARLTANIDFNLNGTALGADGAANFAAFKGNSVINVGAARQATAGGVFGAFTANYPSGLSTLIGQFTSAPGTTAPYFRYLVTSSKITIKMQTNGSTNEPTEVVMFPFATDPTGSGVTETIADLREQALAKSTLIPQVLQTRPIVLSNSASTKTIFGVPMVNTDSDQYTGIYNTNPTRMWCWIIAAHNTSGNTTAFGIQCTATIDYNIVFFDRNFFKSTAPS